MTATELRGLPLLDAAIERIERDPGTWAQEDWRCESGMCLAGQICDIAGGEWATEPTGGFRAYLKAEPGDGREHVTGGGLIHAWYRARRLLGFSNFLADVLDGEDEGRDLFAPGNTLDDIKAMRDDLRARAVTS